MPDSLKSPEMRSSAYYTVENRAQISCINRAHHTGALHFSKPVPSRAAPDFGPPGIQLAHRRMACQPVMQHIRGLRG
jgi:hypothetical protein